MVNVLIIKPLSHLTIQLTLFFNMEHPMAIGFISFYILMSCPYIPYKSLILLLWITTILGRVLRKRFKDLLINIGKEDLTRQRTALEQSIKNWMGEREQLDDMCVVGVRV